MKDLSCPDAERRSAMMHVGMVISQNELLFIAAADSRRVILQAVAGFVQGRARAILEPSESAQIRNLLDQGETHRALDCYFRGVQSRWDHEHLHLEVVAVEGAGAVGVD